MDFIPEFPGLFYTITKLDTVNSPKGGLRFISRQKRDGEGRSSGSKEILKGIPNQQKVFAGARLIEPAANKGPPKAAESERPSGQLSN